MSESDELAYQLQIQEQQQTYAKIKKVTDQIVQQVRDNQGAT